MRRIRVWRTERAKKVTWAGIRRFHRHRPPADEDEDEEESDTNMDDREEGEGDYQGEK